MKIMKYLWRRRRDCLIENGTYEHGMKYIMLINSANKLKMLYNAIEN